MKYHQCIKPLFKDLWEIVYVGNESDWDSSRWEINVNGEYEIKIKFCPFCGEELK